MSEKENQIESKNIKKFYVPKTLVVYFSDQELTLFDEFSSKIVEYTDFVQIGSYDRAKKVEALNLNRFKSIFYTWLENWKDEIRVMSPRNFFHTSGKPLVGLLRETDIVVLVYKSNDLKTLEYIDAFISILNKFDVFAFHFVVENFIQSKESKKEYSRIINYISRKRQVFVPIKEETIVRSYKNSSIANRTYYTNLYINNLIDSFLSPFLDPKRNTDSFSRTKALFYQTKKNFESKVISTMGFSDDKIDYIDLALIQALSNPMFAAAFDASQTFIVNVKMPFILESQIERIREVLSSVVGVWKQFYISTYVGPFNSNKYCQISIMAINVDESKLITNVDSIDEHIKKILKNVQESKNLFENEKTKEIILEQKIELLED